MIRTIAIFGGAFGPPHVGHALVASWIKLTGQADDVVFTPSADHPFGKQMAPFEDRLRWCEAMAEELGKWAYVLPIEADLPKPSYTINLLEAIRGLGHVSPVKVRFVMGVDNLLLREKWRDFDRIEREFDPIYVDRGGIDHSLTLASPKFPNISSTEIRRRLAVGEHVDHLVPAAVLRAMGRHPG